jgi:hypothetical protein
MVSIKQFMEVSQYRITEGSDFGWTCFGDRAYSISAWNGEHDGWSLNITFDTLTQEVYMVESCDYKRERAYRLVNPHYKDAYFDYAREHNSHYMNQAWDGVDYTDLEVDEDWLEKSRKIVADEDYDHKVSVPLELSDEELFQLMKMAHERDVTLNQLVEDILWLAIKDAEKKAA